MNPLTLIRYAFYIGVATCMPKSALSQIEDVVHYDNLDWHGEDPNGLARVIKYWNEAPGELPAQRFTAATDNITAVTMGLGRLGTPGGTLVLDIRKVNPSTQRPGDIVATFATIEIDSLPVVNQGSLPAFLDVQTIKGLVTGLVPGEDYFLHLSDADGANINPTTAYVFDGARVPADRDLLWYYGGSWHIWKLPIRARIQGQPQATLKTTSIGNGEDSLTIEPQMGTYPLDTEVTVTATLEEGSVFVGWKAERITQSRHTNVYDNIEHERDRSQHPTSPNEPLAQQFVMDGNTTLGQVEVELFRKGTVSGSLSVELWNHDDATGDPGHKVADLGVIEDASTIPPSDTVFTFDENVRDLTANAPHWIVANPSGMTSSLDDDNTIGWTVSVSPNTAGSNGRINAHSRSNDGNTTWESLGSERFYQMRVKTLSELIVEPLELPDENPVTFAITGDILRIEAQYNKNHLIILKTDNGSVLIDPEMPSYPIGTEVTVTATPEGGFEFVKWTYGEEEIATNPAIITVKDGATLTPFFSAIEEPDPLQVDIANAVAINWDSQSGKIYQIHASTDMENWEIAVDAIEGTGERLMYCFIREAAEVFYRVQEVQ